MSVCIAPPSMPPSPVSSASATTARPRHNSIPNALHHSLLNVGQRSRLSEAPHEFHDAVLRADTAPKSIRTFKGHAKSILRQLFLALLVRFFVLVFVALGVAGSAAWFVWSHRADERVRFRPSLNFHRPAW